MSKLLTKHRKKITFVTAVAAAALLPSIAYATPAPAAGANVAGFEAIAGTILGLLTGVMATLIGAIAIAITGYRWFSGRMEMGKAVATVAGIVLIIGSAQIVNMIRTGAALTGPASIATGP